MGANLLGDGATFRVWAPGALSVHLALAGGAPYQPHPADALARDPASGHWWGFVPGVVDGTPYRFFVTGPGGSELKRDPWARELELEPALADCDCIVRDPDSYPWHDGSFRPPASQDLVVYQFHVGVYYAVDDHGRDVRPHRVAKLLDVLGRLEHLCDLGVTTLQPLPLVEFHGEWSLGYNGTDLFSPETDYCVPPADLPPYLERVNLLLERKGQAPLTLRHLSGQVNQLKAFIDLCHLYGLGVIPDVVYNHAGGGLDPHSLDHFDLPAHPDEHNDLYFSAAEWAGGRVFDFGRPDVREFLISNARMMLEEYHADGLRFDEVTVIDRNGGWSLCQDLTSTLEHVKPSATLIAEYWGDQPWRAVAPPPEGMGFDLAYADGLRDGVRHVIAQAAAGAQAPTDLWRVAEGLRGRPSQLPAREAYNCLENHDLVLDADGDHRHPRVPRLADASDARSWYARSRSRVATGLLLTAPGVPMLFMGQEFLEDQWWSDSPQRTDRLLWWEGLDGRDRHMADFLRCVRDLLRVRRQHPALRSGAINVYSCDTDNRVVAFHRWVEGVGLDVVVVASLSESTMPDRQYALGFPRPGRWREVLNSDAYDHWPNPWVQGNLGAVDADGAPMHGLPHSALITIPANSVLVFVR
jgi:1,4-alpha-glucan branching enzyme